MQGQLLSVDEPMIFDVGANIGQTAAIYRKLFPGAVIHCFEPFRPSFERLVHSVGRDTGIEAHLLALSNSSGTAKLQVNRSIDTNSLLPSDEQASQYWGENLLDTEDEVEVETATLDEFCEQHKISCIHVLKLDVQGAEYAVLEGAETILNRQGVDIVYMEMIMAPTYVGQRRLLDYLQLLDSKGYVLFNLYDPADSNGRIIQSDIIFVSSRCLQQYEQSV